MSKLTLDKVPGNTVKMVCGWEVDEAAGHPHRSVPPKSLALRIWCRLFAGYINSVGRGRHTESHQVTIFVNGIAVFIPFSHYLMRPANCRLSKWELEPQTKDWRAS